MPGAKRKFKFQPVQDQYADVYGSAASASVNVILAKSAPEIVPSVVNASDSPASVGVDADAGFPATQPSSLGPCHKFLRLIVADHIVPSDECHAGCDVPACGCPEVREGVSAGAAASAEMIAAHSLPPTVSPQVFMGRSRMTAFMSKLHDADVDVVDLVAIDNHVPKAVCMVRCGSANADRSSHNIYVRS